MSPVPCVSYFSGFEFTASGGVRPYHWQWAPAEGSSIPPGLSLDTYGIISGSPETPGTYNITVTANDAEQPEALASANYTITIFP
jgi:hypothetical protein